MLGTVLRHPAVQPLKRAARNAWWLYKGRSIVNPPVPAGVRSVLFVCLGNICRSPFAELVAARRSEQRSPGAMVFASAGIHTKQAAQPPAEARSVAKRFGISLDAHRPQQLTRELVDAYDMVVVMETSQLDLLRARYPDLRERVFLLSMFDEGASGLERYAIADPFGLTPEAFQECYRRIERTVSALLHEIEVRT